MVNKPQDGFEELAMRTGGAANTRRFGEERSNLRPSLFGQLAEGRELKGNQFHGWKLFGLRLLTTPDMALLGKRLMASTPEYPVQPVLTFTLIGGRGVYQTAQFRDG